MSLFRSADSISLVYSNVELAKQWWINAFDCQPVPLPEDWDNPLPSDVALKFRGEHAATVLLSDKSERDEPMSTVPIIFSDRVQKAHEYLCERGVSPGPIRQSGETAYFEIHDLESHLIEISEEP